MWRHEVDEASSARARLGDGIDEVSNARARFNDVGFPKRFSWSVMEHGDSNASAVQKASEP